MLLRTFGLVTLLALSAGCAVPSARPSSAPPPRYSEAAPPLDPEQLAREVHRLVNHERAQRGLPPLAWDEALARLAQFHSRDMAARRYFDHQNPEGERANERGARLGLTCRKQQGRRIYTGFGENLYFSTRYRGYQTIRDARGTRRHYLWKEPSVLARQVVAGWMGSEGHRRNILRHYYGSQGIGLALSPDGGLYVTQNFC